MKYDARDNNFNLVRLFGAALVIYGHSYALTGNPPPGFAATSVSTIGVKIFFSISGYLVSLSWLSDPHLARFFSRRLLRICPALIVIVFSTAFIIGPLLTRLSLTEYFGDPGVYSYLWNATLYINYFLPGLFEHNVYPDAVNGSLWSLPTEFAMYILTPVLLTIFYFLPRRLAQLATASLLVAAYAGAHMDHGGRQLVFYATDVWASLTLAPYFIAGMAFAAFGLSRVFNIYVAFALLFVVAIFDTGALVKEAMLILILPYACLSFASGRNILPGLERFDISYGLFLYGFLIQQIIAKFFASPLHPWTMFWAALCATAVPAYVSWILVEKPALGWKPGTRHASDANSIGSSGWAVPATAAPLQSEPS